MGFAARARIQLAYRELGRLLPMATAKGGPAPIPAVDKASQATVVTASLFGGVGYVEIAATLEYLRRKKSSIGSAAPDTTLFDSGTMLGMYCGKA